MSVLEIKQVHQSSTEALGGNIRYTGVAWQPTYIPEYHVYLYNVSQRTFAKVGPWQNTMIPGVTPEDEALPGMKANEKYHFCTSYPQPMLMPRFGDQSSEMDAIRVDARRYVMDIVNPDNVTLSLDTVVPPEHRLSVNNDLSIKGVFFSQSNPPLEKEVRAAITRMEKYYRALLEKARTLELTDKAKLSEELGSNPDFAYAAEYFGVEMSWNKRQARPEICNNCGESKNFGAAFHINSQLGYVCVDTSVEAWRKAVNAGVKKKDDVPDDFRWWGKKEAKADPDAE